MKEQTEYLSLQLPKLKRDINLLDQVLDECPAGLYYSDELNAIFSKEPYEQQRGKYWRNGKNSLFNGG